MKTRYIRSLFYDTFLDATFLVDVYKHCKYSKLPEKPVILYEREEPTELVYKNNVIAFSVIEGGEEAAEIERFLDENQMDENHEYLVLELLDGKTATFRNSHVSLFVI